MLRHAVTLLAGLLLTTGMALAQSVGVSGSTSTPNHNDLMLSNSLMFFDSEAKQGSQDLPGGTTIYDQLSIVYSLGGYFSGLGLTYQWDKLGETQTNTGLGVKFELNFRGFYLDFGYGTASQSFKNRAVKSRTGTQTSQAFGIRVPFVQGLLFFDGGIKQRDSVYDVQDGSKLRDEVRESIFMPFVGIGLYL
jgi:hypothetical protein